MQNSTLPTSSEIEEGKKDIKKIEEIRIIVEGGAWLWKSSCVNYLDGKIS